MFDKIVRLCGNIEDFKEKIVDVKERLRKVLSEKKVYICGEIEDFKWKFVMVEGKLCEFDGKSVEVLVIVWYWLVFEMVGSVLLMMVDFLCRQVVNLWV